MVNSCGARAACTRLRSRRKALNACVRTVCDGLRYVPHAEAAEAQGKLPEQ